MLFRTFEQRYGAIGARQKARRVVTVSWIILVAVTLMTGLMLAQQGGAESLLPVLVRLAPLLLLGVVLRTSAAVVMAGWHLSACFTSFRGPSCCSCRDYGGWGWLRCFLP